MKAEELGCPKKAGVIPYIVDEDGTVRMYFMVPSDPAYGGSSPQIAKGCIDTGENPKDAALREGAEELGLVANNIEKITPLPTQSMSGVDSSYSMQIYAVKVKSDTAFTTPHFETGSTHWLTLQEFEKVGRSSHKPLVRLAQSLIQSLL